MLSLDLRPAQHFEFGSEPEGNTKNKAPISYLKKIMLHGSADNSKNIVIVVGPTAEKLVVNKSLVMLTSIEMDKLINSANGTDDERLLRLPEVHPDDFRLMLEFMISENNWTYTNLKDTCRLIETAVQLGFYDFIRTIAQSLLSVVQSSDDVFNDEEVCRALMLFKNFDVGNHAFDYILENASSIFSGDQFLQLPWEDFGEILLQDKLKIESEIEVLNALIRWGMNVLKNESKVGSTENLRQVLAELIPWIRFPNIAENEFLDYVIPLKILTDQQINTMELWYKNGGSISAFNCHPRKYLKDSKTAGGGSKSTEELLHESKMMNLLAKYNMNIQTLNLEIQINKLEIDARNSKLQAEELQRKVQWMEPSFEKPSRNTGYQTCKSDYNLLRNVADKIRKNEDVSSLVAGIKEPEGINLKLLESVNETIETKIADLLRVKHGETYFENIMWGRFQKESNSTIAELQKFSNTQAFACAMIFKNNTSETLQNFRHFNCGRTVYMALPSNIQPFCTHNFGETSNSDNTSAVLSYDIGSTRVVVRHYFKKSYNDFGIAILPSKIPFSMTDSNGFYTFERQDWTNDSTKIMALCKAPAEREKYIKLGNLCLHAELIGTGPKAVLRVLLTYL